MKLLLDTNALIWWLHDDPQLRARARALIANPESRLSTSIICLWEIAIKWRIGKLECQASFLERQLLSENIMLLGINSQHLLALEKLAFHHRDPFDHLILAQAQVEGATIITSDKVMTRYGVDCFPAGV